MRKISQRRRLIRMRIARRRLRREAKRSRASYSNRIARAERVKRYIEKKPLDDRTGRLLLAAPEVMDLRDNRTTTLGFLSEVTEASLRLRTPVIVDFRKTKRVSILAMALTLAVIHRCRVLDGRPALLNGYHPELASVRRQFQRSGFYDLLGVTNPERRLKRGYPRDYLPFETAQSNLGEKAETLKNALLGPRIELSRGAARNLYRGVTEAFNNAISHAYPVEQQFSLNTRRRWWLFGHFDRASRNLNVVVVDLGVGIPRTIRKHVTGPILEFLARIGVFETGDGPLIQAATRLGATRTMEKQRGKGLPDLKKLVDSAQGGQLRILSNRGEYTYSFPQTERVTTYDDSIRGTIVHWRVPLAAISNWQGDDSEDDPKSP